MLLAGQVVGVALAVDLAAQVGAGPGGRLGQREGDGDVAGHRAASRTRAAAPRSRTGRSSRHTPLATCTIIRSDACDIEKSSSSSQVAARRGCPGRRTPAGAGEPQVAAVLQLDPQLRRHRALASISAASTPRPRPRRRRRSPPSSSSKPESSKVSGRGIAACGVIGRAPRQSVSAPSAGAPLARSRSDELLDLSARRARQLVDDLEPLRPVLLGDLGASRNCAHLGEAELAVPGRADDEGAGALAEPLVGHRHDRDLAHRRVRVQQLLDLGDRDLLAAAVDHVLDPAGDPQEAVVVDRRQVAGAVPAVRRHRLGGQVGTVEVAVEEAARWSPRSCPPRPGPSTLSVVVGDPDPHAGQRAAVGAPDLRRVVAGRGEGAEAGLGRAPGAADGGVESTGSRARRAPAARRRR